MIINLHHMRNLGKRLPQMWLIEVAGIIMKVRMIDILFMLGSPRCILSILFPAHCKPLFQEGNLLPQPVCIYLIAKAKLRVETSTFDVLLHDVFPHETDPTETRALVGVDVEGEVIAGVGDEAPARLVATCDKELVPRAAKVGGYGISPLGAARILHWQINLVLVKDPSLMTIDGARFQLSWVRGEINTLVDVNGRRLWGIRDK